MSDAANKAAVGAFNGWGVMFLNITVGIAVLLGVGLLTGTVVNWISVVSAVGGLFLIWLVLFLCNVVSIPAKRYLDLKNLISGLESAAIPKLCVSFDLSKHRYKIPDRERYLYRICVRNNTSELIDCIQVVLVDIEPLGDNAAEVRREIHRVQRVPLGLTHDRSSPPSREFVLNPGMTQEIDVISMPVSEGAVFHIQHAVNIIKDANGDPIRDPDDRLPRGDYRLTIQVSSRSTLPALITAEIRAAESPTFAIIHP